MDKKNIKNIIIIIVAIGGVFFISNSFLKRETSTDTLVSTGVAEGVERSPAVQELLNILDELSQLKIDSSIFRDPVYQSLKDYTVTVNPQPKGRRNPFEKF